MNYLIMSCLDKIEALQAHFEQSTRLAEAVGVSRRTLLNWRDRPESIKPVHRLDIDVLYCKHVVVPEWDDPKKLFEPVLLPDDMPNNERLFMPFLRRISYGTIEIETDMDKVDFDRIIDDEKLPKNMSRKKFHEAINTFLTHKLLWQKIIERAQPSDITEQTIQGLHADFMRGVYDNAGFYSNKVRVMGKLEGVSTTSPEDIPEEMNRWVFKCAAANSLEDIAKAHAYFISIHPFGDGNGRVGRALVMMQCLQARLMPPIFDGENRAIYYAAMAHAMKHGRYVPLIRLFHEAAKRGIQK
ncbi:MAG: Fic family protein [Nitrosomonas sp.]|nr:Fic family protein [Nitrosomonas sp.]